MPALLRIAVSRSTLKRDPIWSAHQIGVFLSGLYWERTDYQLLAEGRRLPKSLKEDSGKIVVSQTFV